MSDSKDYTIVGIDGGGTKTRGILIREGKEAASLVSGTTRIGAVGVGESCERTLNVITELCKKAGIETTEIDAIVVGLAGVWLDEEKKRSQTLIRTLARSQDTAFNDLVVTSDAEIALHGAFQGKDGIILIVGTGSIALAKVGKRLYRCGGWGIELDDEGSGAWIGREGLTAVVRALDGRGKATALTDVLAEKFPTIDINQPRTIVKAYAERAFEYQMITPMIMECAENGDEVCLEIITRSATHLKDLPEALQKHFKNGKAKVALMGGIIDADTLLKRMLEKQIREIEGLELVIPAGNALDGAVAIGQKLITDVIE